MTEMILQIVVGILGIIGPILAKLYADKVKADTAQSKAQVALVKLGAIAVAMAGRAWDKLAPQVQAALADGKLTAEERAAIEATVKDLIKDFTSEDDLKQIGEALGLPLPGVIAKVASYLIEKFALAHDAAVPSMSKLAYPVQEETGAVEGGRVIEMIPESERPVG